MKSSPILYLGILFIALLSACGKENAVATNNFVATTDQSLTVTLSKSQITADAIDQVTITVKDQNNADVTAASTIYVNDKVIVKNIFATNIAGSYQIKAVKGVYASAIVNLIAIGTTPSTASVFTQKVLAEEYTGTWCGICPGTLIPLENYTNYNPNVIMIGVHGPSGSNDPFTYVYDTQLRNAFGVGGVPTVVLNRSGQWNGDNTSLDQLSKALAPLGISLATSVSGTNIAVRAQVKFGETITTPLKLVVMLVEDGIPYDQSNYGHFGLPNPIPAFVHRNVLRSTATDIFGDALPTAQQTMDNVWQRDFTIDARNYTVSRCRIVAFVVYDTNAKNLKGALNTQIVNAGQTAGF